MQKNIHLYFDESELFNLNRMFWLCCLFCFSINSAACQSARELTRAKAQSLTIESTEFNQPSTVSLISQTENPATAFWFEKASDSEKPEESRARSIEAVLATSPQLAVLNHLDLITIESVFVKEEKANGFHFKPWLYFTIKARATEKGRALWKEFGMTPSNETIPLAKKQFGSVTGITGLADNQARADFTWKWIPNRVGKSLDSSTEEFKALPVGLQNRLLGEMEGNRQPQTMNFSGEQKITGLFQRFDDGWRLVRFY